MIQIDLSGPEGNVFFLIGTARRFAKDLGINPLKVEEEMKSGDYDNALAVFESYFGDYVKFVNKPGEE